MVRFVAQEVVRDGHIPHFDESAVEEVIREARRRAGRKGHLTLKLRDLGGLVRVAGDVAHSEGASVTTAEHGGGWKPGDFDRLARYERTRNWNVREANFLSASELKRTLFNTTISNILNLDLPELREICIDDGSGHSLDTIELGKVLAYAKEMIGQPLDILGMSTIIACMFVISPE